MPKPKKRKKRTTVKDEIRLLRLEVAGLKRLMKPISQRAEYKRDRWMFGPG